MILTYNNGTHELKLTNVIEVTHFANAEDSPFRVNTRNVLYEKNDERQAILIDDSNEILHTVVTK